MMKVSEIGLELIKHYESLHDGDLSKIGLQPKLDPRGIVTIGYGHALVNPDTGTWLTGKTGLKLVGKYYPQYENMTVKQASQLLKRDIVPRQQSIERLNEKFNMNWNQHQFDAVLSFVYNIGITAFKNSTLFKRMQWKVTDELVRDGFLMWVYSDGKKYQGLVNRRKTEAELYCKGDLKFYN